MPTNADYLNFRRPIWIIRGSFD